MHLVGCAGLSITDRGATYLRVSLNGAARLRSWRSSAFLRLRSTSAPPPHHLRTSAEPLYKPPHLAQLYINMVRAKADSCPPASLTRGMLSHALSCASADPVAAKRPQGIRKETRPPRRSARHQSIHSAPEDTDFSSPVSLPCLTVWHWAYEIVAATFDVRTPEAQTHRHVGSASTKATAAGFDHGRGRSPGNGQRRGG